MNISGPIEKWTQLIKRFPRIRSKKGAVLIVILIIIAGGASFWYVSRPSTRTPQFQKAQVKRGVITASVNASGQVTSSNNASVNTLATGTVIKIYASNGQNVKSGDPIALLELDLESKQRYAQAVSSYQSAQNAVASAETRALTLQATMFQKWDTFKELAESNTYTNGDGTYNYANRGLPEFHIPEKEWLASEAEYKNQEQVIKQTKQALSSAWFSLQQSSPTVYAPISGTVSGLSLQVGSVLSSSGASNSSDLTARKIASVVTDVAPMMSVNLTEIDVLQVSVGDKARLTFDALGEKQFPGTVVSIDTIGSTSSGVTSYPTLLTLDAESITILPNMSVTAEIITDEKKNVLIIPSSALQEKEGKSFVRVMQKGKIAHVPVTIGISSGEKTEIVSGINEGDVIITGSSAIDTSSQTKSAFSSGFGGAGMRMPR